MNAKRYFQLSYIWPVAVAVAILAIPGGLLPDWVDPLCRAALQWAGIPSAVFAAIMIIWSLNKEARTVRRSTYLSPLVFFPIITAYVVIATGLPATAYRPGPAAGLAWFVMYEFLVLMSVLTLGYTYVGVINLVFVLFRSCGGFDYDEWVATASRGACQSENMGAPAWPSRQALADQSKGGPAKSSRDALVPASPYCFGSWEDEKAKGSSPAGPAQNLAALADSSPDPPPIPVQEARRPEAPMPGQGVRYSEFSDGTAMAAPRFGCSAMANPLDYAANASAPVGAGVGVRYDPSNNPVFSQKAHKRHRSTRPHCATDPLVTALLALLAPLVILSAFAMCRRYPGSDRGPAANHRVWKVEGSGAASTGIRNDSRLNH